MHYCFITLGTNAAMLHQQGGSARENAKSLKENTANLRQILAICKKLIVDSNERLRVLQDPLLGHIVTVTELRLDTFLERNLNSRFNQRFRIEQND